MGEFDDHAEAEARRAFLVEQYGKDILDGLSDTRPQGVTKSAQHHADEVKERTRQFHQAERQELMAAAAAERAEDEALETVLGIMAKGGGRTPPGAMAKADRALRRQGWTQGSTAERLARVAGRGTGWRRSP